MREASDNVGTDEPFRPISCYTGSLTSKISGDVNLEETLVTCSYEKDVCFGKVVLTVSNDTEKSDGYIQVALIFLHIFNILSSNSQVEKGCGLKAQIKAQYTDRAKFDSGRGCYVTDVIESNKVINNSFSSNSTETLLSTETESSTRTSVNEEICYCEGSRCNYSTRKQTESCLLAFLILMNVIRR